MHVRVGDYKKHKGGSVIHPEWYLSILKKQKFRKLFIVVREDDAKYLDWYISHFSAFRPTIVSSDIKHDFNFIMQFDRIICSNSTFCWWAAFLSEARTIWTFEPWLGDGARLALFDRAVPSKGDFVSNPFKPLGVFDKAYLINLDIRQDRWQKASQRMRDVGIEAERFVVSVPKDKGTFATPGKRGCSETHLNIVKEAKKRGYDSILILEDDVVFHPKFKEIWAKVWRNVSYSSWDILYFYDWSARQTGHEAFQDNSPEIREIKGTTATHCYAIRKSGYDAIIAALEGEYAKGNGLVVDTVLKRMAGVRKVAIFPQLAAQDSDFSNLTNCQRETRGASWI
jgi:GR25 family glycosyltransferase involved in LPS biosynthesis